LGCEISTEKIRFASDLGSIWFISFGRKFTKKFNRWKI
jgi:hypothetical protein